MNGPFNFCKLIAMVLGGLESFALQYIDNIEVLSLTWRSHMKDIAGVKNRILKANLKVKPTKCKFSLDSLKF